MINQRGFGVIVFTGPEDQPNERGKEDRRRNAYTKSNPEMGAMGYSISDAAEHHQNTVHSRVFDSENEHDSFRSRTSASHGHLSI